MRTPDTRTTLTGLAARCGCDVDALLARIAGSDELCTVIVHKLTLSFAAAANGADVVLSPPRPRSPLPAVLAVAGDMAICHYPELDEVLRATLKALGWQWSRERRAWVRQGGRSGPALDRLVEAACALLAAGFVVALPNADVAQRVQAGNYSPPQEHWVSVLTAGKFAGWFWITWPRGEDLYWAAKRIHGAHYNSPGVVAPPVAYDEVADFASQYGYSLTEGALRLLASAREQAAAVNVVHPAPLKRRPKLAPAKRHERPQALPETPVQEIDDDLRD